MPRSRAGANRTDLLTPKPQAVSAAPNQGYGVAADQQEAQRIAPMAGGGTTPPQQPPGASASSVPPAPQGAPGPNDLMAMAQGFNGPGNQDFMRPTERPNEPVTHGLPIGPGAGPEALTGVGALARQNVIEQGTIQHLLQGMAQQPNATSAIKDLADRAASGVA